MLYELTGLTAHSLGLLVLVATMAVLFVTQRLPVDVTAMGVLLVLVLGGYVSLQEAFSGFSSPVVIVLVCSLFVAGSLKVTGVSDALAAYIYRFAGHNERRAIAVIMLVAATLSAFVNNVSAAALLMPAVAVLAHEADIPPSRLFIPLAFAVTVGGMLTLIGTPPNLIAAELLRHRELPSFHFFSFAPYGLLALVAGILFMVVHGYALLPVRKTQRRTRRITDLKSLYKLEDRMFSVRVPEGAALDGCSLGEIRFGSLVGGLVVTIIRQGRKVLSPRAEEVLREKDVLIVRGNPDLFAQVQALKGLTVGAVPKSTLQQLVSGTEVVKFKLRDVHTNTQTITLREVLRVSGIIPLSVERVSMDDAWESRPPAWFLDSTVHKGDVLTGCIVGRFAEDIPIIDVDLDVATSPADVLTSTLHTVTVTHAWVGAPLSRLAHESHLLVIGKINFDGSVDFLDVPTILPGGEAGPRRLTGEYVLQEGDVILASGSVEEAHRRELLSSLTFEAEAAQSDIESSDVGIVELVLTPRSDLIGRSLADLHFREKYSAQVLALWREGRPLLSLSSSLPLNYGDALLVQGPRKNFPLLAKDPDVLMLSEQRQRLTVSTKAWFALLALLMLVFVPPLTGLPVQEGAFFAACLVVFTGAISMEEAYREIDWRVVFLLALMIPLGLALQREMSADVMASFVENVATALPPAAFLVIFMVLGSMVSQLMDSSIAVIFLGPIAIAVGQYNGGSPHALLLAVTFGSSLAFMLPTSCRSNLLVSGVGGYKSSDFLRVGTPFTLVIGITLLVALVILNA